MKSLNYLHITTVIYQLNSNLTHQYTATQPFIVASIARRGSLA